MRAPQRVVELNEPARLREEAREFRQHLVNASNELYLHEQLCLRHGRELPSALKRAHGAIRTELKRLEAEEKQAPG